MTSLAAYAFLVGSWEEPGSGARETWVAVGDRLLGVGFFPPGPGVRFEILEVAADAYLARPAGREPAVPFAATRVGRDRAVFENPTNDFPRKIVYRRSGSTMRARISGPGGGGGWVWTLREPAWDPDLLEAGRAQGAAPIAAGLSADGALGFTIGAEGVTIWTEEDDRWRPWSAAPPEARSAAPLLER